MLRSITTALSLICLLSVSPSAQITVSSNDNTPPVGTTVDYRNDPFMGEVYFNSMIAGSGGPMEWDFSSRSYSQGLINYSVDPATVPSIDSFPDANLALMQFFGINDTSWLIYTSTPSVYTHLGNVAHASSILSVTPFYDTAPDFTFPFGYNDQWTAYRHSSMVSTNSYSLTYDTSDYTVDAWGTAKYMTASVPCLRVIVDQRITLKVYDNMDQLLQSTTQYNTTVLFLAAGFEHLVSATKVSFLGIESYNGGASAEFLGSPTEVERVDTGILPEQFDLSQNYPNPFNPDTRISLTVPTRAHVKLAIYDVLGREVRVLVNKILGAGSYVTDWDGTSQSGDRVASGVYFYRLTAGQFTTTRKMILLK